MRKIISMLLILCLLGGLCGGAIAEEINVLEFPSTGFTFAVPDFVSSLPGMI